MGGRAQGEWTKIGTVSTSNGMLAIVPPYFAGALRDHWAGVALPRLEEIRAGLRPRLRPEFEVVELRQRTFSVSNQDGYDDIESAFLFNVPENGGYPVEVRFADPDEDGRVFILELRIRLDSIYDEDKEAPAP